MNEAMLGDDMPRLGLGTWRLGEVGRARDLELAAVRLALDMGYRLIDTAEMYGDGGAEEIVGEAVDQALRSGSVQREDLVVVSKVQPQNASFAGTLAACERSLRRLRLDQIDLYLLHWRAGAVLPETLHAFEELQQQGRIRAWGVSNFEAADMRELARLPGGMACSTNQMCYSLTQRGIESELLPWQQVRRMPLMAYCPLDRGTLPSHPGLQHVAHKHDATPAQVALAWLLAHEGVMAIPKAVRATHLQDNFDALQLRLDALDVALLDRLFPAPRRKTQAMVFA